jgi:CBS domain-containing protein
VIAADIMTSGVVSITPQTTVTEIAALLLAHGISGVPVVQAGRVVGIVSEGDLISRLAPHAPRGWLAAFTARGTVLHDYLHAHGTLAGDVMSSPVVSATPDTPVGALAEAMEVNRIKRLPIIDATGQLVGIVTRANLLRALVSRPPQPIVKDGRLQSTILSALDSAGWAGALDREGLIVGDGIAHLWGPVPDAATRRSLVVAVGEVEGVRGVVDHMTIDD